ncbi:SfnB family sulfur acquisition oxidoreductase [Xylophilus sp.]|uniref:SfnB family sulfur acquisition oxidoreductase n=1 Tax=Xylophilus sp. TaxID=2653893 RepID=UPI003FCC5995
MPAHRIADDAEAIDVARQLAADFRTGALLRDRERRLPWAELDALSHSGLLALRVPRSHGGAGVSYTTVGRVVATVSEADPSLGQLFLSILLANAIVEAVGTPAQQAELFGKVLAGWRWGNGHAEAGGPRSGVTTTTLVRRADGNYVLDGCKFYATGALFSHLVSVGAVDEVGRAVTAVLDRHAPGLSIVDDWDGFGQRTTASGTLVAEGVVVEPGRVLDSERARAISGSFGLPDLVHSAIDLGIARAAADDAIAYTRGRARGHGRAGVQQAVDDPYVRQEVGNLVVRVHAAEALLERGTRLFDAAQGGDAAARDEATVALAEAKILTTEAALLASNVIFQLGGASSTRAQHGLDRHWRNARTHTVHDPVHWKYPLIGGHYLARGRLA